MHASRPSKAIPRTSTQLEKRSLPPGLENAKGMMMLVSREKGKGMGLTLFENEDDLKRGDKGAQQRECGRRRKTNVR
jgi:hypothetical protein